MHTHNPNTPNAEAGESRLGRMVLGQHRIHRKNLSPKSMNLSFSLSSVLFSLELFCTFEALYAEQIFARKKKKKMLDQNTPQIERTFLVCAES